MTKVAINKSSEVFNQGDIVIYQSYGSNYGVKILKKIWLDEVSDYRVIVQPGRVSADKWVGDTSGSDKEPVVYLYSYKDVRESYDHKWTPGMDVTKGDVLKDEDGTHYLVESERTVWNLKTGTHASLDYWENRHDNGPKTLKQVTDATDRNFSVAANIK